MSRRLLVLNVILGVVSVALTVGIARSVLVKRSMPGPAAPRAAVAPPAATAPESGDQRPTAYAAIAARNLFNPARNETTAAAVNVSKPILHGIVIDGAKSRAFLEDPAIKRVAGYSVGDAVGGGRLQKITDDRVVIARPEGMVEVLLQDPSKPRPAPVVAAVPGQPGPQAPPVAQGPSPAQGPQAAQGPILPSGQLAPPQPAQAPIQAPPPQLRRRPPGPAQ